ncbi:hypothetical protein [Paenibacillus sp. y28]|uniref:hypothetical protein n=1 Tax=Paenibacillus sp. y28 TaxID=3129110 RepID=UPI00301B2FB6
MKTFQAMAAHLEIVDRTLRRWCSLFEEQGYFFEKDEQGRRIFTSDDSRLLVRFKKAAQTMKLEEAVLFVLPKNRKKHNPSDSPPPSVSDSSPSNSEFGRMEQVLDELQDFIASDFFRATLFMEPDKARQQMLDLLKQVRQHDEQI